MALLPAERARHSVVYLDSTHPPQTAKDDVGGHEQLPVGQCGAIEAMLSVKIPLKMAAFMRRVGFNPTKDDQHP